MVIAAARPVHDTVDAATASVSDAKVQTLRAKGEALLAQRDWYSAIDAFTQALALDARAYAHMNRARDRFQSRRQ